MPATDPSIVSLTLPEGFVYKWTNTRSGKWYIGSHKGFVDDGYVGSGIIFKKAYKKHKPYFVREILYVGVYFREVEDSILKQLDAEADRNSYNMSNYAIGGTKHFHTSKKSKQRMLIGGYSNKGKIVTQEVRDKISKALTGRKISDSLRQKYSEARVGEGNSFFGKSHTDETKRKISEKKKGSKIPRDCVELRAKKIMKCIYFPELDIYFESAAIAGKHFDLHASTISNMLNGHLKNRFGLKFIDKKAIVS